MISLPLYLRRKKTAVDVLYFNIIYIYTITHYILLSMDKQQANDPFIGQTLLERYTVVKKLGEGSFGRIYKATSLRTWNMKKSQIMIFWTDYLRSVYVEWGRHMITYMTGVVISIWTLYSVADWEMYQGRRIIGHWERERLRRSLLGITKQLWIII